MIFVNDRLNDTSAIVIAAKALADKRCLLIKLSRNLGHRIAITAGPDHAAGRAARNHSTIERSAIRPASPMSRWMGERGCDRPFTRDLIATACVLRFTLATRPPVGPVAQWLEPAAHNGLVAGSSPARPTSPDFFR